MPQFILGSVHKAVTTFSNPKTAGFDYTATLCVGAGWTEMASASFHLDAGQSKAVEFTVTMPTTPGTYPVYFKVSSGGVLIGTFVATEAIVITEIVYAAGLVVDVVLTRPAAPLPALALDVNIIVTNESTWLEQKAYATLTFRLISTLDGVKIWSDSTTTVKYSPGQSISWAYGRTIPIATPGQTARFEVIVFDPSGIQLASAVKSFTT